MSQKECRRRESMRHCRAIGGWRSDWRMDGGCEQGRDRVFWLRKVIKAAAALEVGKYLLKVLQEQGL